MIRMLSLLSVPFAGVALAAAAPWQAPRVDAAFAPFQYCVLVHSGGKVVAFEKGVGRGERFLPCSTYKVPHALIGLQAGVLKADTVKRCDPKECHADHGDVALPRAIAESCVSYFRQTARALGKERMEKGLAAIGYPRTTFAAPLDLFWLDGDFTVSAEEQLAFFHRFYTERLGAKEESLNALRAMTLKVKGDGVTLSGKTGTALRDYGWFVGQVERQGEPPEWVAIVIRGEGASGQKAYGALEKLLGVSRK